MPCECFVTFVVLLFSANVNNMEEKAVSQIFFLVLFFEKNEYQQFVVALGTIHKIFFLSTTHIQRADTRGLFPTFFFLCSPDSPKQSRFKIHVENVTQDTSV